MGSNFTEDQMLTLSIEFAYWP